MQSKLLSNGHPVYYDFKLSLFDTIRWRQEEGLPGMVNVYGLSPRLRKTSFSNNAANVSAHNSEQFISNT